MAYIYPYFLNKNEVSFPLIILLEYNENHSKEKPVFPEYIIYIKQLNRDHAYALRPLNKPIRGPQFKVVSPHF